VRPQCPDSSKPVKANMARAIASWVSLFPRFGESRFVILLSRRTSWRDCWHRPSMSTVPPLSKFSWSNTSVAIHVFKKKSSISISGINNWDLVDASAPYIVGHYLRGRSTRILDRLARSPNVWDRRIAIVSTFGLIKAGDLEVTYRIAGKLLAISMISSKRRSGGRWARPEKHLDFR
jgi:hypothetical protein